MQSHKNDPLHPNVKCTDGTIVFINPGTGTVRDANKQHAFDNMRQFIQDSKPVGLYFRRVAEKDYGDGRYAFLVIHPDTKYKPVEIQMPGLPLEQVRFLGTEGQNIWHFPRLYVDGSSFVWAYAILDQRYFDDVIEEW